MELNKEQQSVIDYASAGCNICVVGSAGTGKSALIKMVREAMMENGKIVVLSATTGTAASLIGSTTINTLAGIACGDKDPLYYYRRIKSHMPEAEDFWKAVDCLIIEEFSMMSLHMYRLLDALAKKFKENDHPFGGIQIILFGDPKQLKPIPTYGIEDSEKFIFEDKDLWKSHFQKTIVLEKQYRQDNSEFADLLEKIGYGCLDMDGERYLKQAIRPAPETIPRLFPRNKSADEWNQRKLDELDGPIFKYKSRIDIEGPDKKLMRDTLLKSRYGPELVIKKGAQVMLTVNIDIEGGWCNGTMCEVVSANPWGVEVRKVDKQKGGDKPSKKKQRKDNLRVAVTACHKVEIMNTTGVIYAMPLILAWGFSIHKSQGMTLREVYVDCDGLFAEGHAYVALSRCKSIEGLYINRIPQVRTCKVATDFYFDAMGLSPN